MFGPIKTAVWVRNSFSLLKDEQGSPSHIILVCNDITEHLRAEQLIHRERETSQFVGQLASSIAHEINNPLEGALNSHLFSKKRLRVLKKQGI